MTIRDGDWELVEHDHFSGRCVWRYFDGAMTHYRTDEPVSGLIEQNKLERNDCGAGWKGDWHKVGSVPLNMAWQTGIVDAISQQDDKFIAKFLNDSDNRAWRTKHGTI